MIASSCRRRRSYSCASSRRSFEVDNLLGDPRGVVVVPAGNAYREYLELSAYICQPRRAFKPVERMAFYCRGRIEREIPRVRHVVDEVEFTRADAERLRSSSDPLDVEVADLIERALDERRKPEGTLSKVFLLSGPDDPETERLEAPIPNDAIDANGRTTAWVMMQRYASLPALLSARSTSDLDERA